MNIGIVILCTNSYFVLGLRFINRFLHFYKGNNQITFYIFSDKDPKEYLPENTDYIWTYTTNNDWVEGTNLKFKSFLSIKDKLKSDWLYYTDADTNINQDFTEDWFLGDMVAFQHYADESWMKEDKWFDRGNVKSKAYVPKDTKLPQMYFYGANWGGLSKNVLSFCQIMLDWQNEDKKIKYEPFNHDEGYSNAYFHYNPPTKVVLNEDFKFITSDKGGIGETRNMKLTISPYLSEIKKNKNQLWNIQNGKFQLN